MPSTRRKLNTNWLSFALFSCIFVVSVETLGRTMGVTPLQKALRLALLALSLLFHQADAHDPSKHAWCLSGCQTAFGLNSFSGSPDLLVDGYYLYTCQNQLFVDSVNLCAKKYCSEGDWAPGIKAIAEICVEEGMTTLTGSHDSDAIANADLTNVPIIEDGSALVFNNTAIPSQEAFDLAYRTIHDWYTTKNHHLWYSKAMFIFWGIVLAGGALFNFASWLTSRKVSTPTSPEEQQTSIRKGASGKLWSSLRTHLFLPATFGKKCSTSVMGGTIPPRAESLIIFLFVSLNIVLCAVSYSAFPNNAYWAKTNVQIWRYFSDRTGYLSYANLAIFWAFGIRNNILIWMTGWNFPVFNRFHRWVARVSTIEAILHSLGYSVFSYLEGGLQLGYYAAFLEEYWYTGVIATCAMSLILGFSILWLRVRFYDFFLVTHIVLSLIVLVNLFYHTKIFLGEYDGFLWPCVAFWAFDRLCRLVRIVYGFFTASSINTPIEHDTDGNVVRLDVTNAFSSTRPLGGAYYFLYCLSWKPWESHPFTLVRWIESSTGSLPSTPTALESPLADDKIGPHVIVSPLSTSASDVRYSFIVRPYAGYTARLARRTSGVGSKRFVIEGAYGHAPNLRRFTDVLFVIGGSGISVAISCIYAILEQNPTSKIKLVWASRTNQLINGVLSRELKAAVETGRVVVDAHITSSRNASIKAEDLTNTVSAQRPSAQTTIQEAAAQNTGSLAVVTCGPAGMMDDVRAAFVSELNTTKGDMELFMEAFNW